MNTAPVLYCTVLYCTVVFVALFIVVLSVFMLSTACWMSLFWVSLCLMSWHLYFSSWLFKIVFNEVFKSAGLYEKYLQKSDFYMDWFSQLSDLLYLKQGREGSVQLTSWHHLFCFNSWTNLGRQDKIRAKFSTLADVVCMTSTYHAAPTNKA